MKNSCLLLISAAAACALASCETTNSGSSAGLAKYRSFDIPASLPKNPNAVRVKVSLQNQATYVMEGNKPLMVMPVSVGTSSSPTPRGNFRIYSKEAKRRAQTHGYATNGSQVKQTYLSKKPAGWDFKGTPMPYWTEFKSAYGFHTGWMKPYPCTHGCIRMHENLAPKFFKLVQNGTPVNIAASQPEDATIGRNIPRPIDAGPLPDYPPSTYVGDAYFTNHKKPVFN